MVCLQNLEELEEVEKEDCYLTNETLNKLKPGHIDLLKGIGKEGIFLFIKKNLNVKRATGQRLNMLQTFTMQ